MRTLQILNSRYPELAGRFGPPQAIPSIAERRIAGISLPSRDTAVKAWMIPRAEYMGAGFVGPSGWQDAAREGRIWSSNAAQTAVFDNGIGGQRSLVCDGVICFLLDAPQPGGITDDVTAFSAFFVMRLDGSVTGARYVLGTSEGSLNQRPNLLIGGTTMTTYLGKETGAIQAGGSFADQDMVVGLTFSTTRGVTLRKNGVQLLSDPSAVAPMLAVPSQQLRLWGAASSTNRLVGRGADAIILAADLSAPEYATQLEYIEGAWMAQYGITRGS